MGAKAIKLINFLFNLSLLFGRAREIRNDPESRAKSAQFGVSSIVYSIMAAVFFVVGVFLINLAFESGSIVILVLCGLFGLAFAISALVSLLHAIVRFALQASINRRPITWIALAVLIISLAGAAIGSWLLLS